MIDEAPQWIDDIDPGVFEDSDCCPDNGDEVASLEWVDRKLRRIAALLREKRTAERIVANERARIDQYERDAVGGVGRAIEFHELAVHQWMESRLVERPDVKSYRLPAGTVSSRRLPDKVEPDPEVTLPWLIEHWPELTRKVERVEIDKAALNEAVKSGIGDIPGVAVTTGRVNITVSADGFGDAA
jgi:hypothetical protein